MKKKTKTSWIPRAHPLSWVTLAVTTGAILMTAVDGGILPAVLPAIQQEFGLSAREAGLINSIFFAGLIGGALFFGWLSDRIGTGYRRTWTWNIAMLVGIIGGRATRTILVSERFSLCYIYERRFHICTQAFFRWRRR